MKLSYDPIVNIAYLRFREKPVEVQTLELSSELNIDIAPDGTLYGIELLNVNEQLQDEGRSIFEIINESTGHSAEMKLPV